MDTSPFDLREPFADLVGWCLALLLPAFVMFGPLRRDQRASQAYLLAVFLHIAAAAIYIYFPGILPIRNDSHVFHRYGALQQFMEGSSFGIGSLFFKQYLAHVYALIGPSYFLASILSVYAFACSVVVLVRFMELLDVRQGKGLVILLFGALPTAVLYGSVPQREAYQVLFFMLACYFMLGFRLTNQPLHLIAAIVFALVMGLLHKGLIVYAPFLIVLMLFVRVDRTSSQAHLARRHIWLHRLAAAALAIGFVAWISGAERNLDEVSGAEVLQAATTADGLVAFAEERRDDEALSKGRTSYGIALDTSSRLRFLYSSTLIFFFYLFTPFPWQVRNLLDVYALVEVILRFGCLVAVFRMWRRGGPIQPRILALLMLVYLSMAFLWATGTTNYGTATRHHMIHQWILLLLGVPALLQMRSGVLRGQVVRGHVVPGQGPAKRAGAPRFRGSHGARTEPDIPKLRSLVDASSPPPRLGVAVRPPGGFQISNGAPRLSQGLGRPRRLTE